MECNEWTDGFIRENANEMYRGVLYAVFGPFYLFNGIHWLLALALCVSEPGWVQVW